MINTLIVSGGSINDIFFQEYVENHKFDLIIASDKGLEILDRFNIEPNYIIGDFDSIDLRILNKYLKNKEIKIIRLNPEKDFTDTHMALKLAEDLKSKNVTIIGAIGTRIDHTLANINILKEALDKKINCKLLNEKNSISLINKKIELLKNEKYKFISLIPYTDIVSGITLNGFKYNLENAIISKSQSIGVSNEQIDSIATIELKKGIFVLIESID